MGRPETYWNTLFFPCNTKSTQFFVQEILNNKTIALLGGGRSQIGEEFKKYNITSYKIVNVDPYVENIEKEADTVIPISASDPNFMKKIREGGVFKKTQTKFGHYFLFQYILKTQKKFTDLFKTLMPFLLLADQQESGRLN